MRGIDIHLLFCWISHNNMLQSTIDFVELLVRFKFLMCYSAKLYTGFLFTSHKLHPRIWL